MKILLMKLPTFLVRHWLRIIIILATIALVHGKQVRVNLRLANGGASEKEQLALADENILTSAYHAPREKPKAPAARKAGKPVQQKTTVKSPPKTPPRTMERVASKSPKQAEAAKPGVPEDRVIPQASEYSLLGNFKLFAPNDDVAVEPEPVGEEAVAPKLLAQLGNTEHDRVLAFINRFSHVAEAEQRKFGIPASITLANGLLQSRAGTAGHLPQSNAYFGLGCVDGYEETSIQAGGNCFRYYETAWLAFRGHSVHITTGRYQHLKQFSATDYHRWAHGLEELGYNGTPALAQQLIEVIEAYELFRLD